MLRELLPEHRVAVAPLYADYLGWQAVIDSVLVGEIGAVFADDAVAPRFAVLAIGDGDYFVGGTPSDEAVSILAAFLPQEAYVVVPESWPPRLTTEPAFEPRTRTAFSEPPSWDRARLRGFIAALPSGLSLLRVDADTVEAFEALSPALVQNYGREAFVAKGIGYGVTDRRRFLAGCASYALHDGVLEIEVQTNPAYRHRGFATAAASALILHCLEAGIAPHWDAANDVSVGLALKLGYVAPRPYTAYVYRRSQETHP